MKKIVFVLIGLFAFAAVASAQPRAVGLRFGGAGYDAIGWGVDVSYQHTLGANFLEADLGVCSSGLGVTALYDFSIVENCFSLEHLNLYAGPGAHIGLTTNAFSFAFAAQVGFEYRIAAIPLDVSLDWRPMLYMLPSLQFTPFGLALGVRYRF